MAKAESYNDLIFELGDLARERLATQDDYPRSMDRVFKAEEAVLARREEMAALEAQLNDEDAAFQEFTAQQEEERKEQQKVVEEWKRAVDAIRGRVKDLRKKLSSYRANLRYEKNNMRKAEAKHVDLEMISHDERKVQMSKDNLKKSRLALMRKQRDLEEMGREFNAVLTPRPGQPGAPGILAHRRILEMEDEAEERKIEFDETCAELDAQIGAKDQEVRAAEDYLDQALFLLGEECYASRIADPMLAPLYPRIDKAR